MNWNCLFWIYSLLATVSNGHFTLREWTFISRSIWTSLTFSSSAHIIDYGPVAHFLLSFFPCSWLSFIFSRYSNCLILSIMFFSSALQHCYFYHVFNEKCYCFEIWKIKIFTSHNPESQGKNLQLLQGRSNLFPMKIDSPDRHHVWFPHIFRGSCPYLIFSSRRKPLYMVLLHFTETLSEMIGRYKRCYFAFYFWK